MQQTQPAWRFTPEDGWEHQAECRSYPQTAFFGHEDVPLSRADVRAAQAICLGCPVRLSCLFTALDRRESYGIWGGLTSKTRSALLSESRGSAHAALSRYLGGRLTSP